jgi:ATP-dependent DNA helicase RecG
MLTMSDGFSIAERDLEIRGPGEFLGTKQAGLPDFRHADIRKHAGLLVTARREAASWLKDNRDVRRFPSLKKALDVFWKDRIDVFRTG